jgi:hypothetical protein
VSAPLVIKRGEEGGRGGGGFRGMILMEGGVLLGEVGGPQGRKRPSQRVLNDLKRTRLSCRPSNLALPPPYPLSRQQVVSLSQSSCVSSLLTGELGQGGGGGGAKSYDGEKAWSAINH